MLAELRVGPISQADGTPATLRSSRMGALVTGDGQGRYYEQTSRGNIFSVALPVTTGNIAAGNINGAAAAASTQFALWNPMGTGKNISLLKLGVGIISGTSVAAGEQLYHSWCLAPTNASTFVNAPQCNNTAMAAASIARVMTSTAGTALAGNTILQIIRASDIFFNTAGTIANLAGMKAIEYIDGEIVIPPGLCWVPTWNNAGTSVLVGYSITWEEIPI
jgi:hypothetical protein